MGQPSEAMPVCNKKRPFRSKKTPGQKNVARPVLGDKSIIYLPPMHIKLGLIQISVKGMINKANGLPISGNSFSK